MYELPTSPDERPGCRDSLVITRAILAIVIPPVAIMFAIVVLAMATIITFTISPPWALVPLAILIVGIVLFLRWDRQRRRMQMDEPPGY